jgi:membrane protease subunit HflK
MPWSNQGGGPWGSGGSKGPWGSGPQSSGPTPPDLEELLRRSQDKLKSVLPGGNLGGRGVLLILLAAIFVWGLSGFFRVEPDEQGAVLRFGQYNRDAYPGLNYHLPYPIETVLTPKVTRVNRIDIGMRLIEDPRRPTPQPILTGARQNIETAVHDLMQKTLDGYQAGVQVTQVQLQKVDPPAQVIDSFREVQAARADLVRLQNEAETYANQKVPGARGDAAKILQDAEGYRSQTVAEATGQASRFTKVYEEYKKAPGVTRLRLYLETMERVFAGTDKIILDSGTSTQGGGNNAGVVPVLPLNEMVRKPGGSQ